MAQYISPFALSLKLRSSEERATYRDYLQQLEYNRQIVGSNAKVHYAVVRSAREMIATVEELHADGYKLLQSVDENITHLVETAQEGFEMISNEIQNLSSHVKELTATCDWGFSEVINELSGLNDSIQDLLQMTRNRERTWSYEQFEIALLAFSNGHFFDALKSVTLAIKGFRTSHTGYPLEHRFHHLLGRIRLGDLRNSDPNIVNPKLAESAFLDAAKYSDSDTISKVLNLTMASWAAYVEGDLENAVKHSVSALEIDKKNGQARYLLAKSLMCQGKVTPALIHLGFAAKTDRNYLIKASGDPDFRSDPQFHQFLENLRNKARQKWIAERNASVRAFENFRAWKADGAFPDDFNWMHNAFAQTQSAAASHTLRGYENAIPIEQSIANLASRLVTEHTAQLNKRRSDDWGLLLEEFNLLESGHIPGICTKISRNQRLIRSDLLDKTLSDANFGQVFHEALTSAEFHFQRAKHSMDAPPTCISDFENTLVLLKVAIEQVQCSIRRLQKSFEDLQNSWRDEDAAADARTRARNIAFVLAISVVFGILFILAALIFQR